MGATGVLLGTAIGGASAAVGAGTLVAIDKIDNKTTENQGENTLLVIENIENKKIEKEGVATFIKNISNKRTKIKKVNMIRKNIAIM